MPIYHIRYRGQIATVMHNSRTKSASRYRDLGEQLMSSIRFFRGWLDRLVDLSELNLISPV